MITDTAHAEYAATDAVSDAAAYAASDAAADGAAAAARPAGGAYSAPRAAANAANAAAAAGARRIAARALLVLLLALTTVLLIIATPLFSISDIEINGNLYYSNSTIVSKSGLRIGQNGFSALIGSNLLKMLTFRCAPAELAIASACPYIKTIQVRYVMPRTIRIDIEERSKSVVVPYFGSGLLIDGEGVVVDIVRDYSQAGLPVALGLPVADYEIGKPLAHHDSGAKLEAVLSVINAIKQAERDGDGAGAWELGAIDISDGRNITISIGSGVDINLGDGTEIYYRVMAAKEIIAYGIDEGEEGAIIFSNGSRPVFVPKQ